MLLQVIAAIVAFTKLSHQVDTLNLNSMETDISTTLSVLASHRQNIDAISGEQARIRGVIDSIHDQLAQRTADRFTGREAAALEQRVQRLENKIFLHDHKRASP